MAVVRVSMDLVMRSLFPDRPEIQECGAYVERGELRILIRGAPELDALDHAAEVQAIITTRAARSTTFEPVTR